MLRHSLLCLQAIFCTIYLNAQCDFPVPPGEVCQEAPYICHDLLDGYCSSTSLGPFTVPNNFCGTVESDKWFKFIAGSSLLTLEIIPYNCIGTPTGTGLQAAIYYTDDCSNFVLVSDCVSEGTATPMIVTANAITLGYTYYLFIDGWAGDICDFEINILAGTTNHPLGDPGTLIGPTEVCTGSNHVYNAILVPGATSVNWIIDPPIGSLINQQNQNYAYIQWSETPGTATIIMEVFNECDATYDSIHYQVKSIGQPPPVEVYKEKCQGESVWCDGNIYYNGGTYTVYIPNASWTGCDSMYVLHIIEYPVSYTSIQETICLGECMEFGGLEFCESGYYQQIMTNYHGCDSIIELYIQKSAGQVNIFDPINLSCQDTLVTINALFSQVPNGSSLEWTGPGIVNYDSLMIEVETAGTYCLTIRDFVNLECTDCVEVQGISQPPTLPQFYGADTIPFTGYFPYTAENQPFIDTYTWTISNGIFEFNNDSAAFVLDIQNHDSTQICLSLENECGWSDEYCKMIYASANVSNNLTIHGFDEPCVPSLNHYYIDADTNIINVNWELFGNGSPLSNQETDTLEIQWLSASDAVLCVVINYIDSTTQQTCLDIFPSNAAPEVSLGSIILTCEGELFELCASPLNFDTLIWDIPLVANYTQTSTDCMEIVFWEAGDFQICVTPENACGTGMQTCIDVIVEAGPFAAFSGGGGICIDNNETIDLQIDLIGFAPWFVDYSIDGVAMPTLEIFETPYTLTTHIPGTYVIDWVFDGAACIGNSGGSATVVALEGPEVFDVSIYADTDNQIYTVSFEIMGGDPATYSVTGLNGTLSGTAPYIFTSEPIQCGEGYFVIVDDVNNCNPIIIEDFPTCDCLTKAGNFDNEPIETCSNGPVTANYLGGELLDNNDVLGFILFSEMNNPFGSQIATNANPVFSFVPSDMTYGNTYYISAIAGSDDGNGFPSWSDPCLQLSIPVEVVFYEIPTAILSGDLVACEISDMELTVDFTGEAPFNISINDGTSIFTETGIVSNPYTFIIPNISYTSVFSIIEVSDANCVGNASGLATAIVSPPPNISNINTVCTCDNTGWYVNAEFFGGNPPFTITSGNATLSGNILQSDTIPNGEWLFVTYSDASGCEHFFEMDVLCDCTTQSGQMSQTALILCADETATATYDNSNEVLDCDDAVQYYLHEGTGVVLINPIDINGAPSFDFQAPLEYGTTYYISAVAGNSNGQGNVDLNDPCLAVSPGTPITWFGAELEISSDTTICIGEIVPLAANAPGATDYSWSPANGLSCTNCSNPIASPSASTTYTVTALDASGCELTKEVFIAVQCMTIEETLPHPSFNLVSLNLPPWALVAPIDMCDDVDDGNVAWGFHPNGQDIFYASVSVGVDTLCFLLQHPDNNMLTTTLTIYVTVTDLNGNGGTLLLEPEMPEFIQDAIFQTESDFQNISDSFSANEISIFPNPAKDHIQIISTKYRMQKVVVFNLAGQIIRKIEGNDLKFDLNINDLQSGTYILKIETKQEKFAERIVVIR